MNEHLSLTRDGVEMINYPTAIKQSVAQAAQAWQRFLVLDDSIKEQFAASSLQSGTGYEKKGSGQRESRDIKENFDITSASLNDLSAIATTNDTASVFIARAGELFHDIHSMITDYGQHVEASYAIDGFAAEATASANSAFIRFLYYPPTTAGTIIGEPHVDHSGFTFHLYESTDGCERLSHDQLAWLPMPVEPNKAAAFPSMQTQLFAHGELLGLCHRIIANETTAAIGRTAIVCFVPLVNMPAYDRQTHGRLQDMAPGFNYTIDRGEFHKLFIQD